jgi:hypothetical protein
MPKRILNLSVTLTRGGKRVTIRPNILVDLTNDEIKDIQAAAGKDAVRQPRNEETEMVTQVLPAAGGITNLDDTAANPDASVPAPQGSATSPTTGTAKNPAPAKAGSKADTKAAPADEEL